MFLSLITRCRNEPFIQEFVDHYFFEGVEHIFIIDDNVNDYEFPLEIRNNERISIYKYKTKGYDDLQKPLKMFVNHVYQEIREKTHWLIYVDCDDFITTKRHSERTIRDELLTTFRDVDQVRVPWAMMSCNQRKLDPISLLLDNIWRWDHDRRHPSEWEKGRCRYDEISYKSIFKTSKYLKLHNCHRPGKKTGKRGPIIDSINLMPLKSQTYKNLRNRDIENAYLICYHHRIMSEQSAKRKIDLFKKINAKGGYEDLELIMASDYAEIVDTTLRNKYLARKGIKRELSLVLE